MKLVDKVVTTKVKEKDIAEFIPLIMEEFEGFTKEDVIKHFISAEFNRFIDYYERAGNLNVEEEKGGKKNEGRQRGSRQSDENKTRFFVNIGKRDGLNPGGLLRVVCDSTGLNSQQIGRIDILASFSFFDADNEHVDSIIKKVNGVDYEGHKIKVEVTESKVSHGKKRHDRNMNKRKDKRHNKSKGKKFRA